MLPCWNGRRGGGGGGAYREEVVSLYTVSSMYGSDTRIELVCEEDDLMRSSLIGDVHTTFILWRRGRVFGA